MKAAIGERVVLHNIGWDTYECLLRDMAECSSVRLTYDRGTLEIMRPTPRREKRNQRVAAMIVALACAWQIPVEQGGSVTLRRKTLERGFEPDSCFYIQHARFMEERDEIDLEGGDPPPDLVIEIDVTSPSLEKMPLYAQMGVPEVWRHSGSNVIIFVLVEGTYEISGQSRALPLVRADALTDLMVLSERRGLLEWLKHVRQWAEAKIPETDASGTITA